MDPFPKHAELHENTTRWFEDMIRACAEGWPTARMTQMFLEAERAENAWRVEVERRLG
jgi:hypothetical protein